jgi:HSP20 family protein
MSLTKWQPLEELNGLRQQINQIFDDLVREEPGMKMFSRMSETPWMPAIELQETEKELVLKAQVPGLEPEKLDVQVSENAVFLTGEYQEQKEANDNGFMKSEFHYGQFRRVIPLPLAIQRDHVQAAIVDGLLTLTMPKAQSAIQNVVKVPLTATSDPVAENPAIPKPSTKK